MTRIKCNYIPSETRSWILLSSATKLLPTSSRVGYPRLEDKRPTNLPRQFSGVQMIKETGLSDKKRRDK